MIPNIHIHEQKIFERSQDRQREMVQLRLAAGLRRERDRLPRRLGATKVGFVITPGLSLKQLEVRERQVTYEY